MKKLKNKETGEIGEAKWDEQYKAIAVETDIHYYCYSSVDELNSEWEDYEEPKKHHYYIEARGQVVELEFGDDIDELKEELSGIGNYFETREDAELAVRKPKAWKRLKDNSFRFVDLRFEYDELGGTIKFKTNLYDGINDDLDLLFGGEE